MALETHRDVFFDTGRLITALEELQDSIKYGAIIGALKPLSGHTRESEINRRHKKTFEWMITPENQVRPGLCNISFMD
jgi:hypothetical protein